MEDIISITKPIKKRKMSKKESKRMKLSYLFLFVITFILLIIIKVLLNNLNISISLINIIYIYGSLMLILFIPNMLSKLLEKVIYYAAEKTYRKDCAQYINYDNIKYYRENISNVININQVAYLYDLDLDDMSNLSGSILNLEHKGYIKLLDNDIKFTKKNSNILSDSELYLLESLKNKTVYEYLTMWQLETMVECYNAGLIQRYNGKTKTYQKLAIFIIIFIALLVFILISLLNQNNSFIIHMIASPSFILILITFILFIIAYSSKESESPYIRTKLGEEITARIVGVKEFIKDFSILDKRTTEELLLWNDYLVLACLFNINKQEVKRINNILIEYLAKN